MDARYIEYRMKQEHDALKRALQEAKEYLERYDGASSLVSGLIPYLVRVDEQRGKIAGLAAQLDMLEIDG